MTREERFEIIALSPKESLLPMAEDVRKIFEIKIVKQQTALVMMQAVDSVEKDVFNLGEVLVSEAEVEIKGMRGYSQVLGNDTEKALAGAILDAVCETKHFLTEKIVKMLNQEKIYYEKERTLEWKKIKSSKVEFEGMAER